MTSRYKISDLAKDFNMSSIELINLLNVKFGISISETSVLVEEEIAAVFDMLTREHTVRSFDDYFAIGAEERAAMAKKKQEEKDRKLAEQMALLEQLKAAVAAAEGKGKSAPLTSEQVFSQYRITESEEKTDIDQIQEIIDYSCKSDNSNNSGEKDVDYAIKWFVAANKGSVVPVVNDCKSKHKLNCIQLKCLEFLDEPQEYDHILVTKSGVIIIETKHWAGKVQIRPDKKWLKENKDGVLEGVVSPDFQMRRHEVLMHEILPDVPVYSILCFSNPTAVIDGVENLTTNYHIIIIDRLEETLSNICSKTIYNDEEVEKMVKTINDHKVNKICK